MTGDMKICRPCAVCGMEGLFRCKSCKIYYYCSREHQELDWRHGHKEYCRIFSIKTSDRVGRHLVAKRDLPPGSIVLVEEPLLSTPLMFTKPVCVGCYGDVGVNSPTCGKCGWPVCSAKCADSPLHKPECWYVNCRRTNDEKIGKFDDSWKVRIRQFDIPHPMYNTIPLLRGIFLRDSNDPVWPKLMQLESHHEQRQKKAAEDGECDEDATVSFVIRFFDLKDTDEADLRKIYGILMVNGHEVPRYAVDRTIRVHVEVYENGSLLEHSCIPCCAKRFPYAGGIEIRTVEYVPKGTSLTICYTDPVWGTIDRQKDLCLNKYFFCDCRRCTDPTELGTFTGGVKCRSCQDGYLLPVPLPDAEKMEDLDRLDAYKWYCFGKPVPDATKEKGCGNTLTFKQACAIHDHLGKQLSLLNLGGLDETQEYIRANAHTILHKNHQYLMSARFGLVKVLKVKLLSGGGSLRDTPEIQLMVKTCQDLLEVLDVTTPGVTEIRGTLLFEMSYQYALGVVEKYERGVFPKKVDEDRIAMFRDACAILSVSASTGTGAVNADTGRKLIIRYDELVQRMPASRKRREKKLSVPEAHSSSEN